MKYDDAVAYLQEFHGLPWMENFRTAKDGPGFTDETDGPPYEVWHTAGCGGCVAVFDDLGTAEAVVVIINHVVLGPDVVGPGKGLEDGATRC